MRGISIVLKAGQRFGNWVVLGKAKSRERNPGIFTGYTKVKCDCGTAKEVRSTSLRIGESKSCGCRPKSRWLPIGESALNAFIIAYKQSARRRKLKWALSKKQFRKITSEKCYYCGAAPVPKMGRKRRGPALVNGIDRKDSNIGYMIENCLPCCKACNRMKMGLLEKDFLNQVERIFKYKIKGEINCQY